MSYKSITFASIKAPPIGFSETFHREKLLFRLPLVPSKLHKFHPSNITAGHNLQATSNINIRYFKCRVLELQMQQTIDKQR